MIRSPSLAVVPGLVHGLTTRSDGSVGPATDPEASALRAVIVRRLLGTAATPVAPHQVHGDRVVPIATADARPGRADGVVTTERGICLMVQGADCPLLLLVDAERPALALVHSGWRGTVARITERAVVALLAAGAERERIRAGVFPGIGSCCFEVGPDVIRAMDETFGGSAAAWRVASGREGHALLDLPAAIAATLADAGVGRDRVDVVAGCTACGGTLWSHRASGGAPQRHGLFAALVHPRAGADSPV